MCTPYIYMYIYVRGWIRESCGVVVNGQDMRSIELPVLLLGVGVGAGRVFVEVDAVLFFEQARLSLRLMFFPSRSTKVR